MTTKLPPGEHKAYVTGVRVDDTGLSLDLETSAGKMTYTQPLQEKKMILTWPPYILGWPYLRTIEFADEPKTWWWTDTHVLLRGVGKKPPGCDSVKPKKEFAETASLDVRRTKTKWRRCSSKLMEECIRATENKSHGLNVTYYRLLEYWPKPIKWLVPVRGDDWRAAALAVEAGSQQIVAVVMPVVGAEGWKVL